MRLKFLWIILPLVLAFAGTSLAAPLYITVTTGSGGTALPVQKGKIPVAMNGSQNVTFTAQDGFYLAEVKVNKLPVPLTNRKTYTYQFKDVTKSQSIAAKFSKAPLITAKASKGGTITPPGKVFVPYSTSKTFTIAPNTGYHLESVQADKVMIGTPANYTFNYVKTGHTLSAKFAINTYTVTTQADAGGFIAPAGFAAVKHGQTKVFTIKPEANRRIDSLTVNGEPVNDLPASGPYSLKLTITDDTVIAATFAEIVTGGLQKLQGTYYMVYDESGLWKSGNNVGDFIIGMLITGTFDGNGTCTLKTNRTEFSRGKDASGNDTVQESTSNESISNCSYSLNTDGTFIINDGSQDSVPMAVSTDGNVLVTGGPHQGISDNGDPDYKVQVVTGVRAGSGMTKGSLSGTYHLVSRDETFWKSVFGNTASVSDNLYGNNVVATFNGSGACTITMNGTEFNNAGSTVHISPESVSVTNCSYTVTSDGIFTIKLDSGNGIESVSGWASAKGNSVVMGGTEVKSDSNGTGYGVKHTFGVKAGNGMGKADLKGTFQFVQSGISFWESTNVNSAVTKGINGHNIITTFDGAGGCTFSYTGENYEVENNGVSYIDVRTGAGAAKSCTYKITADGAFTLDMTFDDQDGPSNFTGWASADATTLLIGGPEQIVESQGTNYEVGLMVGTKVQ